MTEVLQHQESPGWFKALSKLVQRSQILTSWVQSLIYFYFRLFQHHRYDRLVLEQVAGKPFVVLPQVFNPKLFHSGDFLARALNRALIRPGSKVLDMGTGSGIGAVFACRWAREVVAADINPEAVRCARINAMLNQTDNLVCIRTDLFSKLAGQRFDVVLFNPPFYHGKPAAWLDYAWRATQTVEKFATELPGHLLPGGYALVIFSTTGHPGSSLEVFLSQGYAAKKIASRFFLHEELTLYKLQPQIRKRSRRK